MQTDNFDDAIRRKVGSIYHSHQEEDIERIHAYVKANTAPVSFWQTYGTTTVVSFFGLVISVLLFLNYNQMQEQKGLLSKIEKMQNNLALANTIPAVKNADTVLIVKYVTRNEYGQLTEVYPTSIEENIGAGYANYADKVPYHTETNTDKYREGIANGFNERGQTNSDKKIAMVKERGDLANTGDKHNVYNQQLASNQIPVSDVQKNERYDKTGSKGLFMNKNKGSSAENKKINDSKRSVDQSQRPKTITDTDKNKTKQSHTAKGLLAGYSKIQGSKRSRKRGVGTSAKTLPVNNSGGFMAKEETDNESSPIAKMSKIQEDTVPEGTETIALENLKSNDTLLVGPEQHKRKSLLSLNNFRFQAGLGIEKANNQFGCGITGEVVFDKKISFSAGVKYLNINNKQYRDDSDYDHQESKNFKNSFAPQAPDTSNIVNIGVQFDLVQIPVALTYYQPMKKNFSLLLSLGTDIDLYANQRLNYDHKDNNSNPYEHKDVEVTNPTILFNNIVFSTGIQKEWNRFVVQASPFLSPQIKTVDYKKNDVYYGLRVRAFYKF